MILRASGASRLGNSYSPEARSARTPNPSHPSYVERPDQPERSDSDRRSQSRRLRRPRSASPYALGRRALAGRAGLANRDLGLDLDEIQRWGATAVISLITDEEIDFLHVRGLREAVEERHMEWWHLPIPDVCPPGPPFERDWKIAGEAIRDRLRMGFDVLVHCRGGLGRAGTVAARLLVELGESPDSAIRKVRKAAAAACYRDGRSEAPHTAVRNLRCRHAPPTTQEAIRDRAVGAMLGLAVGDALGTTLEFQ